VPKIPKKHLDWLRKYPHASTRLQPGTKSFSRETSPYGMYVRIDTRVEKFLDECGGDYEKAYKRLLEQINEDLRKLQEDT
jgi:hypothetical protein